ncbi:MAG: FAD-binding protein [Bacteroidota bacterium]|nr:FAD-binding protein [Bacteroidota bacterium]
MIVTKELVISPESAYHSLALKQIAAEDLGISADRITSIRIRKRSIDARSKDVRYRMQAEIYYDEPAPIEAPIVPEYRAVSPNAKRVIIIGAGPAGMFAALRLIERGIKPIILERGKDVRARRYDLAAIQKRGIVNPDSNYCFGEGGAGTYSDGKLYTRATKRGDVNSVLRALVAHGASPDILIDAHPHIGSNLLPKVVSAMRESILSASGEIHFECRVEDLIIKENKILGVTTHDGDEVLGDAVILATGHSARDIFHLLEKKEILIEAKPFAMGVRIEHPQAFIDKAQYHSSSRSEYLPAASYKLAAQAEGRGVFSFCMCPGGFIVPAATSPGELVLNGMSLSRRDSPFANSGVVVAIETEDLLPYSQFGALAGMMYQSEVEQAAFVAGGSTQRAPAQRITDFLDNRLSTTLPETSYKPGIKSALLNELLPKPLASRLREGIEQFGKSMRGYVQEEAVMLGVETRTSSPVRIPRNTESLAHEQIEGFYPCGEGAGYAGGIVSAAMDGIRVAEAII